MTSEFHLAYLSLGSNIEPGVNLPRAVELLSKHGEIMRISSVWESEPVGGSGGNYLNACLAYKTTLPQEILKTNVIYPIEKQLGRQRGEDKFAPRTIDIDIIIFDGEPVGSHWLAQAFVMVPLAEIFPKFQNPATGESIQETSTRLRREVWIETRRGVLA